MQLSLRVLVAATCLLLTSTVVQSEDAGRNLMQTQEEQREQEREEDALQAYYVQQATHNQEQESMLFFGSEEAVTTVERIEKANRKKQIRIFTHLWENAMGITIVKTLGLLNDLTPKKMDYYYGVNSDAMEQAESDGYSFKVSEALYIAMAVTDSSNDHYHLLDALIYRKKDKNKESKGSGCQYIEYLFTDAEAWAIEEGRGQQFFQGFDNEAYLPLTECFLPECKGTAAKCCSDKEAITSGLCECEVVDKKEGTLQCDHNLFWLAPRTIWLCSTQNCRPDEKCLCPDKEKANKKAKNSDRSKGKNQDLDEEVKKENSKEEKSGKNSKDEENKTEDQEKEEKKSSKKESTNKTKSEEKGSEKDKNKT